MPITSRANTILLVLILAVGVGILAMLATGARGGPLDPPGPVASTQTNVIYQPASCAGFPIVLSAAGSYRLGSNITGCNAKDGIQITASRVSLDLGGFSVIGVPGSLDGIRNVGGNGNQNVSNGAIGLWAGDGLDLQDSITSRVHNVISTFNGGRGIVLGGTSALDQSTASANGAGGILSIATNVTISDCKADYNTGYGIRVSGGGAVVDTCSVGGNTAGGINVGNIARIVSNHAISNTGQGIHTGHSCYIENNSSSWNTGDGYFVTNPGNCTVVNNKATANGGAGFVAGGAGSAIDGIGGYTLVDSNHASGNGSYGFDIRLANPGFPNIVTRNFASANLPNNYIFGANNDMGPIVTAGAAVNPMSNISQ